MQTKYISFEVKEKIAYLGVGRESEKSMVTLTREVLEEINQVVDAIGTTSEYRDLEGLIFFSHKEGCFIAGADINLISTLNTESEGANGAEQGQMLYNKIEDLKIPTVACVDGICLGGGLELALACRHIVASNSSKTILGLPEVQLGLIPGFGGTYRLPLRVGYPKALDMILSGKHIDAKKAYKMELVDEIYPKEKLLEMAPKLFQRPKYYRKKVTLKDSLETLASDNFFTRKIIFQKARDSVLEKTKGLYQAPLKILDVMESGQNKGRASYMALEAQAFGELCISEQSKNLQHVFFLHDHSKKYHGPTSSTNSTSETLRPIKRGAVLGAGTMGGGIAWLLSDMGQRPLMKDINQNGLELGLKQAGQIFSKALERKKITRDEFERKMRSIVPQFDFRGFSQVDLVIEAIVEDMEIKKKVLAECERQVQNDALITTNTSSLSVSKMRESLEHPERFAGLHFFNPVNKMPLVEIITHDKISPRTVETLYKWVLAAKKVPIVVKDGPGFLVNRILAPFMNEATYLLEEGVGILALDRACTNFGMPMGPCRLMDEVGLDVGVKVGKILYAGLGERMKPSELTQMVVEKNFLGKKNKHGIYLYSDEKGVAPVVNPEVESLLPSRKIEMDETSIQMRVFLPMINEAAQVLAEGIVATASEVDLGLIFGIGFPPFRGGLLKYADAEGPENIYQAMLEFSEKVSAERYRPAPFFKQMVEQKRKFYDIV